MPIVEEGEEAQEKKGEQEENGQKGPESGGEVLVVEEIRSQDAHEEDSKVAEDQGADEVVEEGHVRQSGDQGEGVVRKEREEVHHRDDGLSAPSQVFLDLFLLLPSQDPSDDPLSAIAAEEEHQGRGQDDGSCGEEEGDQHVLRGLVVEEHVRKADREHRGDARDDVDDRGQEQEEDIGESLVLLCEVLEEGRDLSFSQEEVGEVGQKKDAEEDRDEDDQKAEEALPPSRRTFSLKQTLLVLCHGFPIIRDFPLFG